MRKIVRVLGKKGRITIPFEIRMAMHIKSGDVLSFSAEDNQVTITKEKLCDQCKSKPEALTDAVNQLSKEEQCELAVYLLRQCGAKI